MQSSCGEDEIIWQAGATAYSPSTEIKLGFGPGPRDRNFYRVAGRAWRRGVFDVLARRWAGAFSACTGWGSSPGKPADSSYLELRWRGYPRLKVSSDTTNKRRAYDMERTLYAPRHAGRRDILELLHAGPLRLPEMHDAYTKPRRHSNSSGLAPRVHSFAALRDLVFPGVY
jgi:hypothetical protein